MGKSRNHKWNDDYEDEDDKAQVMSERRQAKQNKTRQREYLLSNNDVQEEQR